MLDWKCFFEVVEGEEAEEAATNGTEYFAYCESDNEQEGENGEQEVDKPEEIEGNISDQSSDQGTTDEVEENQKTRRAKIRTPRRASGKRASMQRRRATSQRRSRQRFLTRAATRATQKR